MPRLMTVNFHISEDAKRRLDAVIPKSIENETVTYDDFIQAVLWYFEHELSFGQHDIVDLLIAFKAQRLVKAKSENSAI